MAPSATNTRAETNWSVDRAVSLPEIWALVAAFSGLVGAWRLTGVCRAAREGAKGWLGTLPGLVVCGGFTAHGRTRNVWRLNLATLRWAPMPALVTTRDEHACCAVRGTLVVLGGITSDGSYISCVEMLSKGGEFAELPPLSCGRIHGAAAIEIEESDSAKGQVLLIGGHTHNSGTVSTTVRLVDLATGVCTPQSALLHERYAFASTGLSDGRIVCAGGSFVVGHTTAELWSPPKQGATDAAWTWRMLPALSVGRHDCCGCVMSDGRFALLGGVSNGVQASSCEVLSIGVGKHWEALPPMHDSRRGFACAAVAGCIIVAGGFHRTTTEVYDEVFDRWLRLPCNLPHDGVLGWMGSALL